MVEVASFRLSVFLSNTHLSQVFFVFCQLFAVFLSPVAMLRLPTLVSLLFLAIPQVLSSPCVVFDANFNLYAFGLDGKDWNAGTQDSWGSGKCVNYVSIPNVLK